VLFRALKESFELWRELSQQPKQAN